MLFYWRDEFLHMFYRCAEFLLPVIVVDAGATPKQIKDVM
jgi:hypothetical protein